MKFAHLILSLYIIMFIVAVSPAHSATIYVPADQPTIQAGIDAAIAGDTVLVADGTYTGPGNRDIDFGGKGVVLKSENGPDFTIIDCQGSSSDRHRGFTFNSGEDSTAIVSGFTIRNGWVGVGGGIYCYNNSSPTIINNIISGNFGNFWGGGISCQLNSKPVIINNIIRGNSAESGGGIYCSTSKPTMSNNIITANFGSGVYLINSGPVIANTIIWSNTGIQVVTTHLSTPLITYCDIQGGWEGAGNIDAEPVFVGPFNGNVCSQSPCIDAGDPSILDPDGSRSDIGLFFPDHPECSFGNIWYVSTDGSDVAGDGTPGNPFRTIQYGIDVSLSSDTIVVGNGTYFENIIVPGKSIVLTSNYLYSENSLDIENTVIDGDSVSTVLTLINCDSLSAVMGFTITNGLMYRGGGIYCDNSNTTISNNIISGNSTPIGRGGGIYCSSSNPSIRNNTISGNNSSSGKGGGIFCENSNASISNNIISENSVSSGGGIYCENSNPRISNNIISGNSANFWGGGIICLNSNPSISNNTISGNSANFSGGGIWCRISSPSISNNIISNNFISSNLSGFGGGIYCSDNSNPTISNNTISRNSARTNGAGLFLQKNSSPSVENCIFAFNSRSTAIWCNDETSVPTLTCCDVYGSEWGDWVGCIADQAGINGNFSLDPLFCDTAAGDLQLDAFSPCLATPPFNICGVLIGALGQGCDAGYICADANGDSLVNVDDVDFLIDFYFYGGVTPFPYLASDLNCDGSVNIADITYLAAYINGTGAAPCCAEQ